MTPAETRVATVPWEAIAGLRQLLAPALDEILSGAAAERVCDRTLRANRHFSPEQRTVVAEALFGVGLWRRRLKARRPETKSLGLLATLLVDLGQRSPDSVAAWLAHPGLGPLHPLCDWRDRHSVPDWLASELERKFPTAFEEAAAALNAPGPVCLRVNRLRVTREELAAKLLAEGVTTRGGQWSPEALIITSPRPNLYGLVASHDSLFEVQDEGSQCLGLALEAKPGQHVLDLCAGAGGKSLQLAAHVAPTGQVHAFDIDRSRLERLRTRADRAGAAITLHFERPGPPRLFDAILIDAPCSELGSLRRGPDLRWRLDPSTFNAFADTAKSLCDHALSLLKPRGTLVYATCTFRREENEAVVDAALARHPGLRLKSTLQLAPHTHGTDGFFAATLVNSEAATSVDSPGPSF